MIQLLRLTICFGLAALLTGCGTMTPSATTERETGARAGNWRLHYTGSCVGREAEPLLITQLDDAEMVFGDFHLLRDAAGAYIGSALFIASMPVDGREIPYEIAYALNATEAGGFAGTESVVEGGGHGITCPVELLFVEDETANHSTG